MQKQYVLGYYLAKDNAQFYPITEGHLNLLISIKPIAEKTLYHGDRDLTGAQWEIRAISEEIEGI